ncbi:tRNA epoxyqueuosine(34) reductase QueG [Falseniella ignava]|uniref:tRNA epoxyqueuosine(34) reductase QueG n=1 Tax=Falseniella ignava TaxID=137730 RepID=A0A2I1K213_9LACT|nr:tRNA epoxyqueuosine(34) reductase QueG [Falseniella ignava]PKY89678.1 tRNA epoxyqueuosine(34) reductase QueG [Falseniella ignava]
MQEAGNQTFKEAIRAYAHSIGIDKIGFTHAEPFLALEPKLRKQQALGHQSGFEHPVIEERIYPELTLPKAQSFISIALAYPSRPKQRVETRKGEPRGSFARASWGIDYHHILREKLALLVSYIEQSAEDYGIEAGQMVSMVDTGEFSDVSVAARAGLGFIGRNGLLISREFGSYMYLGEILTSITFEPDPLVDYDCGDCDRCIRGCPTQALLGDGSMNAKRCLSYQTQTKTLMPREFRKPMGRVIYGCDICQIICPYNRGIDVHHHPEMEPEGEVVFPELKPMLKMSNREFKAKFGHLAGSWRGKKPLQRNAIIALANYQEMTAVPILLELIEEDPRPEIRATAAWALGEMPDLKGNQEVIRLLKRTREQESDSLIQAEYDDAIYQLEMHR